MIDIDVAIKHERQKQQRAFAIMNSVWANNHPKEVARYELHKFIADCLEDYKRLKQLSDDDGK